MKLQRGLLEGHVRFEEFTGLTWAKAILIVGPCVALIAAALWIAVQFMDPMPPRRVVLAGGPESSAMHALALRYAKRIAAHGIDVQVQATRGAGDNLALLADPDSRVDLAFLFAGTATPVQASTLVNIATVARVPVWLLGRLGKGESVPLSMKGRRVAVGAPGTGLEASLAPLLADNGITEDTAQLRRMTPDESVRALAAGEVEAIFLTDDPGGKDLKAALSIDGVRLLSLPRAAAYARRYPHLEVLTLPEGSLDLASNVPDRDVSLIGTSMMIAARSSVHPMVVDLVVDAARELHGVQNVFDRRGEFPSMVAVDAVPMSPQALTYAREGQSVLRRYLPLWAADSLQRAMILAIPLIAVVLPLVKGLPLLLELLMRRHVFRGYARLGRIERSLRERPADAPVDDLLRDLARIEESIAQTKEPVMNVGELYTLRVHLRVVREAVLAHVRRPSRPTTEAPA